MHDPESTLKEVLVVCPWDIRECFELLELTFVYYSQLGPECAMGISALYLLWRLKCHHFRVSFWLCCLILY